MLMDDISISVTNKSTFDNDLLDSTNNNNHSITHYNNYSFKANSSYNNHLAGELWPEDVNCKISENS